MKRKIKSSRYSQVIVEIASLQNQIKAAEKSMLELRRELLVIQANCSHANKIHLMGSFICHDCGKEW
jgi:hypothetical protein